MKKDFRRTTYNLLLKTLMIVSIIFTVVFIISLVSFILYKGIPEISFDLLFSVPSYISEKIGILPDILNTIYVIFTTLIFVLPIGLGAGKWRVIKTVVIPQCIDGIVTGIILSVGKIIGESAALLFTAGFAHSLNGFLKGLTSSGSTLTVALYVYAKEQGEFGVAFAIAVILLILTFIINTVAEIIGKNLKKGK